MNTKAQNIKDIQKLKAIEVIVSNPDKTEAFNNLLKMTGMKRNPSGAYVTEAK